MASDWITHVKKVAAEKKISYSAALKVSGASYKKKGSSSKKEDKPMDKKPKGNKQPKDAKTAEENPNNY